MAGVSNLGCAMKKWKMSPSSVMRVAPRRRAASRASRKGPFVAGPAPDVAIREHGAHRA